MNFLSISQTYGRIGIETQSSRPEFKSQASRLNLTHTNPQVKIEKQAPRVIIDQSACFSSAGLKNNAEIAADAAHAGYQQAMQYIAKCSSDGDMLANIKSKRNAIAEIAARDSIEMHEYDIVLMPSERPKIDVEGYIKVSVDKGKINTDVEEGSLDISFTKPQIRFFLLQKPSLNIEYAGKNFDASV